MLKLPKNMKHIILIFSLVLLIAACDNSKPINNDKIATQNEILVQFSNITAHLEQDSLPINDINAFVGNVLTYYETNPEDVTTPDLMLKAGLLTTTLAKLSNSPEQRAQSANQAIEIFSKIEKVYPENENAKKSILNKAFVYDEVLQDYSSAETIYRDFINRYPNDSVSVHLRTYIEMLGKSPDEIMAEIKKNEEEQKQIANN